MVGGLIEDQKVCFGQHQLGEGNTTSFSAGQSGDQFEYIIPVKGMLPAYFEFLFP